MKKRKKIIKGLVCGSAVTYAALKAVSKIRQDHEYDEENDEILFKEGKEETSLATGSKYARFAKRAIDVALSLAGLVVLAPVYAGISLAIVIDDPGPVLFTQKRVGLNKTHFKLHKFRSMKMCTPHDTPTHLLENPEQYITRVGKFLRKYSLDELPQIWDIFIGNMSIIGPRPALWNQFDLVEERDKYGANDVRPGLTGWAQINGRDELEIDVKARLDGDYVKALHRSSFAGLKMDLKCFFGTIFSVAKAEGVVEGGTGEMHREESAVSCFDRTFYCDFSELPIINSDSVKKNVIITGANSYIGMSVESWIKTHTDYSIHTVDMIGTDPEKIDFSEADTVFHVAGIAHRKETKENAHEYYEINRDLAVKTAEATKNAGVKQFIILSTMGVYGRNTGNINFDTVPDPQNHYSKAKYEADCKLAELNSDTFKVCIVRPPMVYGKGCKGNYQKLRTFALKMPLFPKFENKRSMIHIDNLASVITALIQTNAKGIVLPQDYGYVNTSEMVRTISIYHDHRVKIVRCFDPMIRLMLKRVSVLQKVFGSLTYEDSTRVPNTWLSYTKFDETMKASEGEE